MVNRSRDRDADRARHLPVVDAGADHRAKPRALEQEVQHDRGTDGACPPAPADRSETRSRAIRVGACRFVGVGTGIESPPHSTRQASEMMKDMPSVTSTCPSGLVLSRVSTSRSNRPPIAATAMPAPSARHPDVQAVTGAQRRRPEIGAEHEEGAVRQVGQPHQAEDQREARRQQEQQTTERQAVETLDDPKLHRLPILSGKLRASVPRNAKQDYCSRFFAGG